MSNRLFGVDLFSIDCVSMNTVLTLIAEIGQDIYKFKTAKQFASYLRLAPNNRISGGKLISSRTPKGANRFALCLRNAANTIDKKKGTVLCSFFKRIAYKKGRGAAITATARKLSVIIWNMIVKKQAYNPMNKSDYEQQIKGKTLLKVKKIMLSANISMEELSATC